MGIPPKKTSTARTSTQENNTQHIKIPRKKQLFLFFYHKRRERYYIYKRLSVAHKSK